MAKQLSKKQKDILALALKLESKDTTSVPVFLLDLIHKQQEIAKGEKGDEGHTPTDEELLVLIRPLIPEPEDGDDGHTPTDKELLALIRPLIPVVQDGEDGKTPTTEELAALIGPLIPPPLEGSPDSPDEIADKLNLLEGAVDMSVIRGLDKLEKRVKETTPRGISIGASRGFQLYVDGAKKGLAQYLNIIPGTGVSMVYSSAYGRNDLTISASATSSILVATGTRNDSNMDFTFVSQPAIVVINGASYRSTGGAITWTWTAATLTVTLSSAVGSGGDIYGIS